MAAASGANKVLVLKKETAYGVLPAAAGGRVVSRSGGGFNLAKESYKSNRIRSDLQEAEGRHGVRTAPGSIEDDLAPGSASDLLATVVKRLFTAVAPMSGLAITVAGTGPSYTIARAAGSWITSGLRIGQVFRLTAGTFAAANLNKNLFVVDLTALVATVIVANGSALVAEGPISAATATVPGRYTYVPATGHTDESYSFEEWFADVPMSETYVGWKPNSTDIKLPGSGLSTISISGEGADLGQPPSATRYFTSPTGESSTPLLAAVNGVLRVNGVGYCVTNLDFKIDSPYSGEACVGSNIKRHRFAEGVMVSGSFTAYFEGGVLPALFYDETATALDVLLTSDNTAISEFLAFSITRVKVNSADKDSGKGGILRTYQFTAAPNPTAGAREATTIAIHDSLAT